jgi:hypothetical protein
MKTIFLSPRLDPSREKKRDKRPKSQSRRVLPKHRGEL